MGKKQRDNGSQVTPEQQGTCYQCPYNLAVCPSKSPNATWARVKCKLKGGVYVLSSDQECKLIRRLNVAQKTQSLT